MFYIVLDNLSLTPSAASLMNLLKDKLSSAFDVSFSGQVQSFIGCETRQAADSTFVFQQLYSKDLTSQNILKMQISVSTYGS